MKFLAVVVGCVALLSISGCDSYTAEQYQTSPKNTIYLQQLAATGKRASVGNVTTAEGVSSTPACRLAGPIDLGGGNDANIVVKQALQAEFLAGNIYNPRGRAVNVIITQLTPNSLSGSWTIGLKAYTNQNNSVDVVSVTNFKTSFSAAAACRNVSTAFNRALADAIHRLVVDPKFKSLL